MTQSRTKKQDASNDLPRALRCWVHPEWETGSWSSGLRAPCGSLNIQYRWGCPGWWTAMSGLKKKRRVMRKNNNLKSEVTLRGVNDIWGTRGGLEFVQHVCRLWSILVESCCGLWKFNSRLKAFYYLTAHHVRGKWPSWTVTMSGLDTVQYVYV